MIQLRKGRTCFTYGRTHPNVAAYCSNHLPMRGAMTLPKTCIENENAKMATSMRSRPLRVLSKRSSQANAHRFKNRLSKRNSRNEGIALKAILELEKSNPSQTARSHPLQAMATMSTNPYMDARKK